MKNITCKHDAKHAGHDFFSWRTILHLSSYSFAPRTYCRILHYFQYPPAWDPLCQSTFLTSAWLDLRLSLVLTDSLLVCLFSGVGGLLSVGSELADGTGSELSSWRRKKLIFSIVFHNIMLSCKIWSVTHANEQQKLVMQPETDIGSKLPLTLFSITHPGLAAFRVAMF